MFISFKVWLVAVEQSIHDVPPLIEHWVDVMPPPETVQPKVTLVAVYG